MIDNLASGLDPASFSSVTRPADDFYRYVNGPWIDTYTLPDDKARFGAFDKLAENAEKDIRDILEDEASPAIKSAVLYRSFLDTDAIEQAGITPIKSDLDAVDKAPSKAALTTVLGTLNPAGGPDLIGFMVYPNPGDPDHNITHVE